MQKKIIHAGVTHTSFANASENLLKVGDSVVSAKQVERVTQGIGLERCVERDEDVALYQALPLIERKGVPARVTPPPVAVVGTDGGRIANPGTAPWRPAEGESAAVGSRGGAWRPALAGRQDRPADGHEEHRVGDRPVRANSRGFPRSDAHG